MEIKSHFSISLLIAFILFSQSLFSQTSIEFSSEQVFASVYQLQEQHKEKIDAAFAAMEAVQKAGAYVESLSDLLENGEITLPVGIKKGEYELIIQKIKLNTETGKPTIFATCAFKFKEDGQRIAFEGQVDIEGQKGLGTEGQLELIAPVKRQLGQQVAIVFNAGTKANFGCDGIESFLAKIDLFLISDQIYAVDNNGKETGKALSTSLEATFSDFDSYTVSFGFNQSFSFKGIDDVIFTLKGASFDQSDIETSSMIQFPENYFTGENADEKKLWKGIAITEASIALPAFFKKSAINEFAKDSIVPKTSNFQDRIELGLQNVLIDENGFSSYVSALNIMNSDALDKTKWDISVNDFLFSIEKNELKEFGFGGDLNVPPLGKNSLLGYSAKFNPSINEYEFQINVSGKYDFPVLQSSLTLNETSSIELLIKDSDFYPTLNASGSISIDAPITLKDTTKKFTLPDIAFENMKISRDEPYLEIGAIGITGELKSPKIAGFELSISDIHSFDDGSGSGLAFDAGVKLSSTFAGEAGLQLYGDYARWQFEKINLNRVNIDYESGAFSIYGGVEFKNGDEIYGTGFRGEVGFSLIDKFNFDAVAVFGKKDNYRYFLTDVYFETSPISGITILPALSFYGFGGGLYQRMQQSFDPSIDSEFGKSLSGINYIPDNKVGMGFMTTTKFGLIGSESGFNAKVGFEIQFNNYGGLNFIQLRGDAAFMQMPSSFGKLSDNIAKGVEKLEAAGGELKVAKKSDLKEPENMGSALLSASMMIKYDFANKIFNADLSAYLNAGVIKGVGPNGRMCWASAYFSPDKWYTYLGTPSDRMGVSVLGLATIDGYFMLGDDIPELPPPPQKVLQNFSLQKQQQLTRRESSDLTAGSGIAFGQSFGIDFDATLPPFYARFGMGMGGEFLLKNYGSSAYCAGGDGTLGLNGWYARAQAWAWVEASIGMEAKIFGSTKSFNILDLSASALLAGAGPNPFYFTGAVGGRFSALGGLVSGQCDFDFEVGEECIIMGGSPFGMDVIAQLTPATGENKVNVFAAPQAVFNIPVGLEMEVEEAEGLYAWYKVVLEDFSVTYVDTKQKVEGYKELSTDGKVFMVDPDEPFESEKDMRVYAKVSFLRKLNGQWIQVEEDGKPLYEEKEETFKSGVRPKEILPEHVKYSYPIANQYNYYPEEYKQGYVMVSENYSYLFTTDKPEGFDQAIYVSDIDGNIQETGFSFKTHSAGNDIRLEIDYSMANISYKNDEIYKLAIVNVPQERDQSITSNITTTESNLGGNEDIKVAESKAEGTLDILEQKEVYALNYRTSSYNTFKDKMAAMQNYDGVVWQEYPHVYKLISNIVESGAPIEMFDYFEQNPINPDESTVILSPVYENTTWYNREVAPLIYENNDAINAAKLTGMKPPSQTGIISLKTFASGVKLSDDLIESNARQNIIPYGAYHYRTPYYIDRDFIKVRTELANNIITASDSRKGIAKLLAEDNIPDVINGDYEIRVEYSLPGKDIITSGVKRIIEIEGFIE